MNWLVQPVQWPSELRMLAAALLISTICALILLWSKS
jgi:hypothetical protein